MCEIYWAEPILDQLVVSSRCQVFENVEFLDSCQLDADCTPMWYAFRNRNDMSDV